MTFHVFRKHVSQNRVAQLCLHDGRSIVVSSRLLQIKNFPFQFHGVPGWHAMRQSPVHLKRKMKVFNQW